MEGAPRRGYFVTGTGTEVGKTVVAAVTAHAHARRGERVAGFKPALSGLDEVAAAGGEPDHALLRRAAGSVQRDDEIAPYRYRPAVSPHLGAELAGERIDPERIRDRAARAAAAADVLVCEGVGGFLVPLTLDYLVRDLARDLALPVLIASSPGLGTINHTLLTIEAVRRAGLEVRAVVLTPWPARPGTLERSNRDSIEQLGRARVEVLPAIDLAEQRSWPHPGWVEASA
ncbi:MAG TPA: dethiobiotin synthase [Solirubrobacterales bacterium]|nr:dethiobiotin synthase [Solirubrobacterales bacterium]